MAIAVLTRMAMRHRFAPAASIDRASCSAIAGSATWLVLGRESIDRRRSKRFTRAQNDRWEARVIHGIWKVLGLERKTGVLSEDQPTHAGHLSIEPIAREELHARLARPDLEHPSGPWLLDASGEREPPAATVEN